MLGRTTEQVMREFCSMRMRRPTALFHGRRLEEDLDAEVRPHLEMAAGVSTRRWISAEEARREARRALRGVEQAG
jgi:hypothetical protein